MGIVSEILARARATKSPRKGEAGEVAQFAAVDAALADLTRRRGEIQRAIGLAAQRREEMLIADAPDEEIRALDAQVDAWHLDLERMALIEPKLVAQMQALRDEARRQQWEAAKARGRNLSLAVLAGLREAERLLGEWHTFAAETGAAGFHTELLHTFPTPPPNVTAATIGIYAAALDRAFEDPAALAAQASGPKLFSVRFRVASGLHMARDVAGFEAEPGWALVKAGLAEWAEPPERVPPLPPLPEAMPMPEPRPDGRVIVRFIRTGYASRDGAAYVRGDLIGFDPAEAEAVVRGGYAECVRDAAEAAPELTGEAA